jgi:hypothetical protein
LYPARRRVRSVRRLTLHVADQLRFRGARFRHALCDLGALYDDGGAHRRPSRGRRPICARGWRAGPSRASFQITPMHRRGLTEPTAPIFPDETKRGPNPLIPLGGAGKMAATHAPAQLRFSAKGRFSNSLSSHRADACSLAQSVRLRVDRVEHFLPEGADRRGWCALGWAGRSV